MFRRYLELFILLLLISYPSISALLYTPALPNLSSYFQISDSQAQATMSLFLVGYALGMLPYGPIANRFGRKKALFGGLVLALLGTLIAWTAPSFSVFCLGRFLQALGAAAGLKITFTMIGDQYEEVNATKSLATLTAAFGIMPGIGVALGGFLTVRWGWQGCFAFLFFYTLFLIVLTFSLKETSKTLDGNALNPRKIFENYGRQFKSPSTLFNGIMMGLASALIYVFGTAAPLISMRLIGISPDIFGLWNILPSLGLVSGTLLARKFSGRLTTSQALLYAIILMLAGTVAMGFGFAENWIYASVFFIPMLFIYAGDNFFWINASSSGLSQASDKSNASAVMQFMNIGIATLATFIVLNFSPTEVFLIPIAFAIIILLMIFVRIGARYSIKPTNLSQ